MSAAFNVLTLTQVRALRAVASNSVAPMGKRTRDSLRHRGLIEAFYDHDATGRAFWKGDMLTPAGRVALGLECGHGVSAGHFCHRCGWTVTEAR